VRRIAGGRRVVLVPMARLDISASMVREKFCAGLDVSGLVPEAVRGRMLADPDLFRDCWNIIISDGGIMVGHIVMWKLKETAEGRSAAENGRS
jgi:hypothetical protein